MNNPQNNTFTITKASLEDLDLIAPLFDAYRVFYKQPSDLAGARRFLAARLEREQSTIFLAVSKNDETAVGLGFTQLYPSFSSISMRPLWVLNDLFVAPQARHLGIGRALMDRARQFAVETNAKGLTLSTATDNIPAQTLYESLGYLRNIEFYNYTLLV